MILKVLPIVAVILPIGLFAQSKEIPETVDLKTAMDIAKQNYPSIKLKNAEKEASLYQLKASRNNYLPGVIVQSQVVNGTSNQVRGPFFPNEGMAIPISGGIRGGSGYSATSTWTSFATGFVNWKFFSFGRFKTEVDAAKAGTVSAEADFQNEVFQQQIKVGDGYFLTLMADDMLKAQVANLARVKALKDVTSAYTKSGLKPGVDSSLVNAEYSKATLQLLETQRIAQEQVVYFKELMGLKADTPIRLDSAIYATEPQSIQLSSDYSMNPLLTFYKSVVDLNQTRIKAIRRSQYPSISFIGAAYARGSGISNQANTDGSFQYNKSFSAGVGFQPFLNWMVGVSTIWNVTSLFKTGNEARAQRQVTTMAQERYNEETLRVESEIERARLRYNAALEAARQAPIQLKAAQDAYSQAKSRYDAGLNTILELTQTYALLNRAEVDASMAKGNVWRAIIMYSAASGNMSLLTNNLN